MITILKRYHSNVLNATASATAIMLLSIPKELGIPQGHRVYFVAEIMHDKRHPTPFDRSPLHGPFSDHAIMGRLGVHIEWKTPTGWKAAHLQSYKYGKLQSARQGPGVEHVSIEYLRATYLYDTLVQAQYPPSEPSWRDAPFPILVKEVRYGHLNQVIHPTNVPPTNLPAVQELSGDQVVSALRANFTGIKMGAWQKEWVTGTR